MSFPGKKIILPSLVVLLGGAALGSQEPVIPSVPSAVPAAGPGLPAVPSAPQVTWNQTAPSQTIVTPAKTWSAEAAAGTSPSTLWSNGTAYPYSGSRRGWNSHELLAAGPGGVTADLTGPGSQKASLVLEEGAQGWWRATAGDTGALEVRLPAGSLHLSYRGEGTSRGYLTARDLMIAFPTASVSLLQYGNGDFLLVCHSGWADVKSGSYRFRMGNQRGYERIGTEVRYFEVPAREARQIIRDWRQAADTRALGEKMPPLPSPEAEELEKQWTSLRGWGAELQYWHSRLAAPGPLTASERESALSRLETPVSAWETALTRLEQTAGKLDQSASVLEKAQPQRPGVKASLKPWQDRRSRWHNLLSQLRFALGLHSRLSAPLPTVQTVTPAASAAGSTAAAQGATAQQLQNLQDLTDPKKLLQGLLEGM